jgi:hypothetical protein
MVQIFERARLPNEVLGRIWFLSDTKQRGALDATEFTIGGTSGLDPKDVRAADPLRAAASYKPGGRVAGIPPAARTSFGSRPDVPPIPAIPQQFTGPQRTASPMNPGIPRRAPDLYEVRRCMAMVNSVASKAPRCLVSDKKDDLRYVALYCRETATASNTFTV